MVSRLLDARISRVVLEKADERTGGAAMTI